jgi:hypothetical protein
MRVKAQLGALLADLRIVKPCLVARRTDLQLERFEEVVHSYAVDTNILYFIGQPIAQILAQDKLHRAPRRHFENHSNQLPHIGSLFRSDEQHYHLAIGAALAQFIGFKLSGTNPLLLPDALWPEAQTLLANFSSFDDPRAKALADELFRDLESRTIKKIDDKLRQADLIPTDLTELLQKMVHQKIGRQEGLRRISALFDGGLIEKLSARPLLGVSPLRPFSAFPQKLGDVQEGLFQRRQRIYDKWYDELGKIGKQDPHRKLDANALTQIELRNQVAHEHQSTERTLYITLDSAVVVAAERVRVDYLNCSFADAYVRHPASFLNDVGLGVGRTSAVDRKTDGESVSILDWIDVMLNKSSPQLEVQSSDKIDQERAARLADEILEGWHDLSEVQEDQLFFQLGIAQIERSLHEKLSAEDIKTALDKLRDEVIEEEALAWENCFRVAIQLALNVQLQDLQQPTRSSPPICYEGWPDAGEAIEQFKMWGAYGLRSEKEFEDVRKQLEEGEDKSGYSYFLASAAFFAARGDWAPAAGLASFARELAYRLSSTDRNGANGREATYLEAVARQHLVRHSGELARVVELVEECKQIFEEEEAQANASLQIVPERFDLELLDIQHVRCLFRWDAEDDSVLLRSDMRALLDSYGALQHRLQRQVDPLLTNRAPMVLGGLAYTLVQTEIRTIISAFLLVAVNQINLADDVRARASVSDMLSRLSLLSAPSSKRRGDWKLVQTQDSSILAQVAKASVRALLARAEGRHPDRTLIREARNALRRNGLNSHYTFPFDERRFEAILATLS